MADKEKDKKQGREEPAKQLLWRRISMVLLAISIFCFAATIYGMAPVNTAVWKPMQRISPLGPDTLRVVKDGTDLKGIILRIQSEDPDAPDSYSIDVNGEVRVFKKAEVTDVVVRHFTIRPMLFVAAAIFLVLFIFLARKLWGKLVFHKPKQGLWVRMSTLGFLFAMAVYGAYELHFTPASDSYWAEIWWQPAAVLGIELKFKNILFPSVGVVLWGMTIAYLLINKPKAGDFLIETEGELRKVSWPARKEYVGSSIVVLIVSVAIAGILYGIDLALSAVMPSIGGF